MTILVTTTDQVLGGDEAEVVAKRGPPKQESPRLRGEEERRRKAKGGLAKTKMTTMTIRVRSRPFQDALGMARLTRLSEQVPHRNDREYLGRL